MLKLKTVLVLLLFLFIGDSCLTVAQPAVVTKEMLLKDIDFYSNGILKNHVDPFKNISRETFLKEIETIKRDSANKSADEIIANLRQLNARMLDEHSSISGFKETNILPLRFYWFEEGIYVENTSRKYASCLYGQLIAINNVPVHKVISLVSSLLPNTSEGAIKEFVASSIASMRVLHGLSIADNTDSTSITIINNRHDTVTLNIQAAEKQNISFTKRNRGETFLRYKKRGNYWFEYDSVEKFIYVNYASCFNDPSYPFASFQADFFSELAAKHPDKIIIDLRDNGGGVRATLYPFIDQLRQCEQNKKGHVFVLIGRKTFSAAVNNVFDLSAQVPITTIGEPTAGNINHFGQVKYFTLPNTKLTVAYSTNYIVNKKGAIGPLLPDVTIPETLRDYLNGVDAALDFAINKH